VHVRNSGEQNRELIAAFSADGIRLPNVLLKEVKTRFGIFSTLSGG
jgi:hypothetical protein